MFLFWMELHKLCIGNKPLVGIFVCQYFSYSEGCFCWVSIASQMPLRLIRSSFPQLSCVRCFATLWTAARQASLSVTISQSLLKLMSIESVMPSPVSSSFVPFSSCPQSFLAAGSFPTSRLFASGGQGIGASASAPVLPVNIQS